MIPIQTIATLLLVLGSIPAIQAQPAQSEPLIIALGDSVAAGVGSSLPRTRGYPTLLRDLYGIELGTQIELVNLAEPGESSDSFVADGQLQALAVEVDSATARSAEILAVTLTLGGNDILDLRDASNAEREAALTAFMDSMPAAVEQVRLAIGPETPLLVSTIYDPTLENPASAQSTAWWIEQFNAVIRQAADDNGATIVDLANELGEEARDLTRYPVDVHPTNEGHVRIAAEFWRAAGVDTSPPVITLLSPTENLRRSPTLRFAVSPDSDLGSLRIRVDEPLHAYESTGVSALEFVVLVDARATSAASAGLEIEVLDYAGNRSVLPVELAFSPAR